MAAPSPNLDHSASYAGAVDARQHVLIARSGVGRDVERSRSGQRSRYRSTGIMATTTCALLRVPLLRERHDLGPAGLLGGLRLRDGA